MRAILDYSFNLQFYAYDFSKFNLNFVDNKFNTNIANISKCNLNKIIYSQ